MTRIATEAVMTAAKANDANTAEALKAAQDAVTSLVALKGMNIFGSSPAGKSTDQVFGQASGVIDDLITEVKQAITVLNENLHASVDAVVKDQEVSEVDYTKLTKDNKNRSTTIDTTGLKPGDPGYVPPTSSQAYDNTTGSQNGSDGSQGGAPAGDPTGSQTGSQTGATDGGTGGAS